MHPSESQNASSIDPWWKRAVVYQIYPRSFADSDGDGTGDVPGIIAHLDYLQHLGIDVIWLSPVYASPQDDNGYDISDYQDIDPMFGTLDDMDRLIAEAHGRGIRIVMDLVVNHTSDEHAWFQESRSSADNAKRDWYIWRSPRDGKRPGEPGAEPTNTRSFFGGSVWEFDDATGEYYLHLFSRKQPDLNWENPDVRDAVYAMMNWWLDRGIDGFRMDVINLIAKRYPFHDGDHVGPDGFAWAGAESLDLERNHALLKEMRERVFAGRGALLTVGEMPGVTIEEAVKYTDPAERELDMVFHFEHVSLDHGASKYDPKPVPLPTLKANFDRWQLGMGDRGWNSLYWNNHDQPRVVSRFGDDGRYRVESAKALGTILHLQRGTPYIYQGEELGMTNHPFASLDDFRDIEAVNVIQLMRSLPGFDEAATLAAVSYASRDNARTPMQWDASPGAGFTQGKPWIAVNPNAGMINATAQLADPDSVFHYYRQLIELRHTLPVIAIGEYHQLLADDPAIWSYERRLDGDGVLVVANCSAEAVSVPLEPLDNWREAALILGNYPASGPFGGAMQLEPWEVRVYRRSI